MTTEDTLPWYRQFWPWFIIALPASAVVAGLFTVWLAMQSTDSLAVRSEDGVNVATERNLAAEAEADRRGLRASIEINSESGAVVATMLSGRDVDAQRSLELQLLHPTLAARDMIIELSPAIPLQDGVPVWAGHLLDPPSDRRYVRLSSDGWLLSAEWSGAAVIELGGVADGGH